jgi:hypothetical protein
VNEARARRGYARRVAEIVLALLLGPALWLAGAIFFDFVHFVLHRMLGSRFRILRALAWPHSVHHAWIDRNLDVQWHLQRRNVWCHIVPEYGTQLAFTAALALLLPLPFVVVLAALQTAVFLGILRMRGLDPNHRPIAMLDAYRPGPGTPPAYHALHHVHPDAYFSAYTKAIDFLVRGAAWLRGRRFVLQGASGPFARALAAELRRQGVEDVSEVDSPDAAALARADVLVLFDPGEGEAALLEAFIDAARTRKLPPEAWALHARPDSAVARHYLGDVRIHYRTLVVPDARRLGARAAERAARRVVSRIRRGCHFVTTAPLVEEFRERRRLRATVPASPGRTVRHRSELLAPAAPA